MAKYKVGDKVRVKSKEWYDKNKSTSGTVYTEGENFVDNMAIYCGSVARVTSLHDKDEYFIDIDNGEWIWHEDTLEDIPTTEQSTLYTDLANAINKLVIDHKQPVMVEEKDGSIIITPIEEKEEDLPIDTPVMCSNSIQGEYAWFVRYYAGDGKTWWDLGKSCNEKRKVDWKCIISFDKFDPTNIEESLKHNIVKHG